jgi:hypothetical protein
MCFFVLLNGFLGREVVVKTNVNKIKESRTRLEATGFYIWFPSAKQSITSGKASYFDSTDTKNHVNVVIHYLKTTRRLIVMLMYIRNIMQPNVNTTECPLERYLGFMDCQQAGAWYSRLVIFMQKWIIPKISSMQKKPTDYIYSLKITGNAYKILVRKITREGSYSLHPWSKAAGAWSWPLTSI